MVASLVAQRHRRGPIRSRRRDWRQDDDLGAARARYEPVARHQCPGAANRDGDHRHADLDGRGEGAHAKGEEPRLCAEGALGEDREGHAGADPLRETTGFETARARIEPIDEMGAHASQEGSDDGLLGQLLFHDETQRSLDRLAQEQTIEIALVIGDQNDRTRVGGEVLASGDTQFQTREAAHQAYEQAGVGPEDLDLVELHDCFATAELVHYDNLMLCEEGGAVDFFESGAPWRDGSLPVNVSGGLQSKGHPISATGIANIWEVCHHLRGEAEDRQIEDAKVGLAHVIGLGSACGVHILEKSAA